MPALLLAVALACSVGGKGGCPEGQFCTAEWDAAKKRCPDEGRCVPLPKPDELELSLPWSAGDRLFCGKGGLRRGADSHNACNASTRFAFDFVGLALESPRLVLAPADGVAFPFGGCAMKDLLAKDVDPTCNFGFGNVVRVQHRPGLYSQVAHLSSILVRPGQKVRRGDPLGFEGNTGSAGGKHIHFSLHAGEAKEAAPAPTIPVGKLRTKNGTFAWDTLPCGDWTASDVPDSPALVSDNAPTVTGWPRFNYEPPSDLAQAAKRAISGDAKERAAAEESLRAHPEDPAAFYWLGVALALDGKNAEARTALERGLAMPNAPPWLKGWSHVRLGDLALAEGKRAEAKRLLEMAREEAPGDLELQAWARRSLAKLDAR